MGIDDHGFPVLMEVTESAWVLELEIEPVMLLGSNFFSPRGAVIDYAGRRVTFANLNNFEVLFQVYLRAQPCVRKVTLSRDVLLNPGGIVCAPATYVPLPSDRDFMFEPLHENSVAALVKSSTLPTVVMANLSPKPKATWKGCLKAVMVAAVVAAAGALGGNTSNATGITATDTGIYIADNFEIPESFSVNVGFLLTPTYEVIATEIFRSDQEEPVPTMQVPTDMANLVDVLEGCGAFFEGTPVTDAVFTMMQDSENRGPTTEELLEEELKPKIPGLSSNLGIKKSPEVNEIVAPAGQSIYTGGDVKATDIFKLLEDIPEIWTD
ncbi:hypothetical protein EV127DRAFT_482381 [Xylaria flabelliformis]|nr:hypothetical protein EV127DRAFT_482381 [Xylaria flabelliformis]